MVVLGINAYHADSAAALLIDGKIVAAVEEERIVRVKHWAGFPIESIRFCLNDAGLTLADLTHIAVNTQPAAAKWQRVKYSLLHWPSPKLIFDSLRARSKRQSVKGLLEAEFLGQSLNAELVQIEHHQAHLASAHFASDFEESVAVSIDGFGDFASAAWGVGQGSNLSLDGRVGFPDSLGIFYQAMTQYLGFPNYGDEYKVMGLAPYGEPNYVDVLGVLVKHLDDGSYRLDTDYFRHHRQRIAPKWTNGVPVFNQLFSNKLEQLLGPARDPSDTLEQRHKDLARSVQVIYEMALFKLLNKLYDRFQIANLSLAGGCAQNSVANGKIAMQTPFKNIYVAAAGYDAGGAIGAAMQAYVNVSKQRPQSLPHAQLGPKFSSAAISEVLDFERENLEAAQIEVRQIPDLGELCDLVSTRIIDAGVIGWFQGRMEWGPRALGQRSILADPRRADMKEILNIKIKRRESFRPFAPSVLRECVADWFEFDSDVPFMGQVFPIRAEKQAAIPAVTHVDGSGRLQTVSAEQQAKYHALIHAFWRKTGVPMLLNTSFNENEPIVCTPKQALDCFLRTKMDMLVMEDWVLQRKPSAD